MPRTDSPRALPTLTLLLLTALLASESGPAVAAWPIDPTVNVPLCSAAGSQHTPVCAPDGAGGSFVAWQDQRESFPARIHVQYLATDGTPAWASDGIPVSTAEASSLVPKIVADGQGGAIIAWIDHSTSGGIRAQRFAPDGAALWAPGGVLAGEAGGFSSQHALAADGAGGATIVWSDRRDITLGRLHAQRLTPDGQCAWSAAGLAVPGAGDGQASPAIVGDGQGGAVVVWEDITFVDGGVASDLRAQRLTPSGQRAWQPEGVPVCGASGSQGAPAAVPDGEGGAYVAWFDASVGAGTLFAQRVTAGGQRAWTMDGVPVSDPADACSEPSLAGAGADGVVIAWRAWTEAGARIAATRLTAGGAAEWTNDVGAVRSALADFAPPALCLDDEGGAVMVWADEPVGYGPLDLFGQRLSRLGQRLWRPEGVVVCSAASYQDGPVVATDGQRGVVVAWRDDRDSDLNGSDIYAQRVFADGRLGGLAAPVPTAGAIRVSCVPNPFNPRASISFEMPAAGPARLEVYDLAGRHVRTLVDGELEGGVVRAIWDGTDACGRAAAAGSYLLRLETSASVSTLGIGLVR